MSSSSNGRLRLSFAFTPNPRTTPLLDGEVGVEGVELIASRVHPAETFWRQLHFEQFDVSEMSFSSFLAATAGGACPWVAIPIFTSRHFFHTWILINQDSGIERPEDLKGRRVGVPEYQQTAALWSRGILEHEFGVSPRDMEWYMGRRPGLSHGSATGFTPPDDVSFTYVTEGDDLGTMLVEQRIDALLLHLGASIVDKAARRDPRQHSRVRPLFPDPEGEGRRYRGATGIFPANHVVVVRRTLVEKHPWLAINLYQAFARAKRLAVQRLLDYAQPYVAAGAVVIEDGDVMPYGVAANSKMLETLLHYSYEQGLIPIRLSIDDLFDASTLALPESIGEAADLPR